MKNLMKTLSMLAAMLLLISGCTSELNDPDKLPTEPETVSPHVDGFGDEESENFHGTYAYWSGVGWNLSACKSCHGSDYEGGLSGQSCNDVGCHVAEDNGPEACYTCHGDWDTKKIYPEWYPTHPIHLEGGGLTVTTVPCTDCHSMAHSIYEPEHINGITEVYFRNPMAAIVTKGREGDPVYNQNGSCDNMYCHGNFTNGNNRSVGWKGPNQAACGTCHGDEGSGNPLPKAPHPAALRRSAVVAASSRERPRRS